MPTQTGSDMRLVRLFAIHGVFGFALGLAVAALLVGADFRGLGTLVAGSLESGSPDGLIALAMLGAALGFTCGGCAIATAVMLLPEDDADAGPRGGLPVPVRARSRSASQRRRD